MIEKIIDWCTNNRAIVLLFYTILSIAGIYCVIHLPVDAIPDLSENQVIVYTEWMGRSPQVVEDQVTFPLVSSLQGLAEVKAVRASTMFGMSFVFVIFNDNTDIYFARNRVAERLNTITSQLPQGAVPTIGPDGSGTGHVFWYTLEGPGYDLGKLRSLQDWFVRYKLASVEGVAEVAGIGGFVRQYQVDVLPEKLKVYDLSFSDIVRAIQRNNNEVGGKIIESSGAEYFIRGQGYIQGLNDVSDILISTLPNGYPVKIKDIAHVQEGGDIRRGSLEANGTGERVGGIIVMRNGQNARDVINRVKQKIAEVSTGLPPGVTIKIAYDRSLLVEQAVGTLNRALIEAAIVVSIMVALFLMHFRSIIRILIELPVSVLIAFIMMYVFKITSNIMSLGGIILAVGVVVDSSIVLVENAYRNLARAQKENPSMNAGEYVKVSVRSAKQVARAIFFSELIILISFLPVFLLSGQEGKLFSPLAYTKTFTMLASAIVVITLIPVLMTMLMRGNFKEEKENIITRFFNNLYEPVIKWVLKHRKITIAVNIAALLITIPMLLKTGSEFMPPLDEGSLLFMPVTLPNVSITEVNRILQQQDAIIKSVPEVEMVLGKAGKAETATDNAPLSMIETIIQLKPKSQWRSGISKQDIIQELDRKLQIPGVRNGWTQPIINRINMLSTGVRTDLGLKIFGANPDTLEALAIQAESILKQVPGAADVVADRAQNGYYIDVEVNDTAAERLGVDKRTVQDIIESAIGGQNIGLISSGRERFPIRVRMAREFRDGVDELKKLIIPIPAPNISGQGAGVEFYGTRLSTASATSGMTGMQMENNATASSNAVPSSAGEDNASPARQIFIPLGMIANVRVSNGPSMLNSENGMLRSVVFMNARGADMGAVMDNADRQIKKNLVLPKGYTIEWSGQYESKTRAQNRIMMIMPVVFVVIFILLFFTLKDYREAAVVMLSVPFALIGGVYMIYFLGYNFSVAVWVGFIALYGIAVETGVVMVVYLHEALDKRLIASQRTISGSLTNRDIYEAAVEGSVLRLRPKLMTVFTSMIGLVPVMWSTGTGADVMKPLTAPMIGGLLTSAIHVLVVTPVLFVIMKERALRKGSLHISKMSAWMKEGE
ncbi:MAG: CusA/CzcA family heavy metal efflux RND transporter [Ignavibacteria bacterium]|nr:CusA/CzcA family heavy metal efflux RND transporter [Ignavibacteria bacterium]